MMIDRLMNDSYYHGNCYYASLTERYLVPCETGGPAPGTIRWCTGWSSYPTMRERLAEEGGPFLPENIEEAWWFPDVLRGPLPYALEFKDPVEFFPVQGPDGLLAGYLFRWVR